jgi:hypothetical protein
MSSLKANDGEVFVDNRASGDAIPGWGRISYGTAPSAYCMHCGGHVMLNPLRERPREYCRTCNHYICDGCAAVAKQPEYKHRTIDDLTEMVSSGRFVISGGSVCDPILIPTYRSV